ncbi:hypothetical protein Tco_1309011, partial [Tanacetum coccineum]
MIRGRHRQISGSMAWRHGQEEEDEKWMFDYEFDQFISSWVDGVVPTMCFMKVLKEIWFVVNNRIKHIPVICQKDMPRMVSIGDVVRAVASKLEAKKEVKEAKKEVKETKKEDKPVVANKKDAKQ